MFDVVALGELLVDFTCLSTSTDNFPVMAAHPGGAPCNFLAALSNFGASTSFLGKVGDDAFGALLRNALERAGINVSGLLTDQDAFTTLAFVSLNSDGERSFSFARKPGADTRIRFEDLDLSLIEQCKVFHFGSLSLTHEPSRSATYQAVEFAKQCGKLISYDPNFRPPLWDRIETAREQIIWGLSQADIVKISDDEVSFLFGLDPNEGAKHILSQFGAQLVFVTCGADGCIYDSGIVCGHTSAPSCVHPADTTGAGDIFGGSALWKILQLGKAPCALTQEDLREITRFACAAATLSTTSPGGMSSIPDLNDICTLLTSGKY